MSIVIVSGNVTVHLQLLSAITHTENI